jgi:hypothetical protein
MPCYQSTSLPSGVTTTGRTSYATQADCLQACQEGACCEGTSCSVKPQCQCKCRSNSCCGPDTMTVNGVTGPRCRGGTESECAARGGVWRPCYGCSADAATPDNSICSPGDRPQANAPSFKGVGTTCTPNPCDLCDVTSISIGTTGTASGFYQSAFNANVCPDASYSVSASGSGSLSKNNSYLNSLVCSVTGATPKCSFLGNYSSQGGASVQVVLVFFTVGNDVRFSVQVTIRTTGAAAQTACDRTGLTPGNVGFTGGAVCVYESCSDAVGTVSSGGGLIVDLQSVAPLQISGGGSYGFAARGGSITVSFNPLP